MTPICTILDVEGDITYAPAMARVLLILSVVIIIGSNAFSQTEISNTTNLFEKYYKDVQAFGVPYEANDAEHRIAEYMNQLAHQHGFATKWQAVKNERDYHSFASNLHIGIPGKSSKQIVLVVPLDKPEKLSPDQNFDPYLTPAIVCQLMDRLSNLELPISLSIEVLAAEDGVSPGLGTRHFLENTPYSSDLGAVCLSINSVPSRLEIIHGGGGKVSPAWLLNMSLQALTASQLPYSINTIDSQLYRLGVGTEGLLAPFLKSGIPAVQIKAVGQDLQKNPSAFADQFSGFIIDIVSKHSNEFIASSNSYDWDGNYLVFNLEKPIIIPERAIALFFLASIITYLFLVFLKRNDRMRYVKSFAANIPTFAGIIAVSFISFILDAGINYLLLPTYSIDPIFQISMAWLFIGKILGGIALMMAITRWAWPILPKQSSFYASAAFICSIIALFIVATISITLSVYLMVCTLCISLANLSRPRWLKILFFIISALCILQPVYEALRLHPVLELDNLLLRQLFPGSILLTLLSIPFVFMWCRILLFLPMRRKLFQILERFAIILLLAGGLVIVVGTGIYIRGESSGLADLTIERIIHATDKTDELLIKGAGLLRPGRISYGQQNFPLKSGMDTQQFGLESDLIELPSLKQSVQSFLGRKTMSVQIISNKSIHEINAMFTADRELLVHSLNFPYRYVNARTIQILIGKSPPQNLSIELTLPINTSGTLELETKLPDSVRYIPEQGKSKVLPSILSYQNSVEWQ